MEIYRPIVCGRNFTARNYGNYADDVGLGFFQN